MPNRAILVGEPMELVFDKEIGLLKVLIMERDCRHAKSNRLPHDLVSCAQWRAAMKVRGRQK